MKKILYSLLLLTLLLSGCNSNFSSSDKLKVVTSIFPLGDILQNLGGEEVEVKVLIDPGLSPHDYDPKPSDISTISDADVIFMVGGSFDGWMNNIVSDAGVSPDRVIKLKDMVTLLPYGDQTITSEDGTVSEVAVTEENFDPHFWLSPMRVREMVDGINQEYKKMDPDNAALYDWEKDDFLTELDALDQFIKSEVDQFTIKKMVTFHNSFGYFAHDYGLEVIGTIEDIAGVEPTPEKLRAVNDLIKENNLSVVFIEPQLSTKVVEALTNDLPVQIGELDPLGGIEARVTYQSLIRYNVIEMRTYMKL